MAAQTHKIVHDIIDLDIGHSDEHKVVIDFNIDKSLNQL